MKHPLTGVMVALKVFNFWTPPQICKWQLQVGESGCFLCPGEVKVKAFVGYTLQLKDQDSCEHLSKLYYGILKKFCWQILRIIH